MIDLSMHVVQIVSPYRKTSEAAIRGVASNPELLVQPAICTALDFATRVPDPELSALAIETLNKARNLIHNQAA